MARRGDERTHAASPIHIGIEVSESLLVATTLSCKRQLDSEPSKQEPPAMSAFFIRCLALAALVVLVPSCGLPGAAARTAGNTVNTMSGMVSNAWSAASGM